jgi:hypothetical protein
VHGSKLARSTHGRGESRPQNKVTGIAGRLAGPDGDKEEASLSLTIANPSQAYAGLSLGVETGTPSRIDMDDNPGTMYWLPRQRRFGAATSALNT